MTTLIQVYSGKRHYMIIIITVKRQRFVSFLFDVLQVRILYLMYLHIEIRSTIKNA